MDGISGHIWFNGDADQAVELYTSLIPDSKVGERQAYTEAGQDIHGQQPGSTMVVEFSLAGRDLIALNGGPVLRANPSVSLVVDCPTPEQVDQLWEALSPGGKVLMELGEYPFSDRYGWVEDRFGLSWQLAFGGANPVDAVTVTPCLLYTGEVFGRAEEAIEFYTSVFPDSGIDQIVHQPEGPDQGTVMWSQFSLAGQAYRAMESSLDHDFTFTDGFSFLIACEDQAEVDHYWATLGEGGQEGPCGWLKDRFGVSWQVAPVRLQQMLAQGSPDQVKRVTECFMGMKKLDLAELEAAFGGS